MSQKQKSVRETLMSRDGRIVPWTPAPMRPDLNRADVCQPMVSMGIESGLDHQLGEVVLVYTARVGEK